MAIGWKEGHSYILWSVGASQNISSAEMGATDVDRWEVTGGIIDGKWWDGVAKVL